MMSLLMMVMVMVLNLGPGGVSKQGVFGGPHDDINHGFRIWQPPHTYTRISS